MLRPGLGLVLVLALGAPARAEQPARKERVLFTTQSEGGAATEFWTSDEVLLETPEWRPADGDPPLSVARAVTIASAEVKAQHPKFDEVEVQDIHMMSASCGRGSGARWFYSISFSPVIDGQRMFGGQIGAVVLMNGALVEPRVRK